MYTYIYLSFSIPSSAKRAKNALSFVTIVTDSN